MGEKETHKKNDKNYHLVQRNRNHTSYFTKEEPKNVKYHVITSKIVTPITWHVKKKGKVAYEPQDTHTART